MKIAQTRSFKGKIVKENFLPSGKILHIDLSVVNHWCLLSNLLIRRIQIGVIDEVCNPYSIISDNPYWIFAD